MTTTTPTVNGGTITSWSVSPSLPAGLSLDSSTGAISGTPSAVTSSANYTITATNTGGSDTATITIVVNDIAPSISYGSSSLTLTKGTAMTTETVTSTGGAVVSILYHRHFQQPVPGYIHGFNQWNSNCHHIICDLYNHSNQHGWN